MVFLGIYAFVALSVAFLDKESRVFEKTIEQESF